MNKQQKSEANRICNEILELHKKLQQVNKQIINKNKNKNNNNLKEI